MKYIIEIIPHSQQRYETVGDWVRKKNGNVHIKVSKFGNPLHEILVGIHELIEERTCFLMGISQGDVDDYDIQFEKDREIDSSEEPGDSSLAPYNEAHIIATDIERQLARSWSINWNEYNKLINELKN